MDYIPKQGDIIWLNFTPGSGHEQSGRRPGLVVSNTYFNRRTGLVLVCPITNTKREYPLHVELKDSNALTGHIMVEQVKSLDYTARNAEFIEEAKKSVFSEVLSKLNACL